MSLLFAVKVFDDLCLYFAAAGAVGGVCGQAMNGLWPMLVCAACAGLCCFAKSKPWRLLPLLLLGLCCLFPQNRTDWLLILPAMAYAAFLATRGRFELDHGDYQEFFPRGLAAAGLAVLVSLLGLDTSQALQYSACYILCGVYLLRQLRLNTGRDWKDKLLNLLVILAVLAAGYLSSLLFQGAAFILGLLLRSMKWLFLLMEALLEWLFSRRPSVSAPVSEAEQTFPALNIPPFQTEAIVPAETSTLVPILLCVLLCTAAAVGIFFLVRRMFHGLRPGTVPAGKSTWTEPLEDTPKSRRSLRSTNRDRVRQCYQKFLRLLRSRGASLRRSDTSAQVHDSALPLVPPLPAEQLRDLYRRARYDESSPIGPAEVRQARECLRQIGKD